jgi:serine/threonine protein kinase
VFDNSETILLRSVIANGLEKPVYFRLNPLLQTNPAIFEVICTRADLHCRLRAADAHKIVTLWFRFGIYRMKLSADDLAEVIASLSEHGYELDTYLGSGSFGVVYLVKTVRYGASFAIKIFSTSSGHTYNPSRFAEEFEPLVHLTHPSIVRFHQVWSTTMFHYILLDFMSHGTVLRLVREQKGLNDAMMRNFGSQILSAFAFCHSKNIFHGDVKPANIFLDELSRPRVADFGLSTTLSRLRDDNKVRGSIAFLPPEKLLGRPTNPAAADVWALGVTFFIFATNSLPWRLSSIEVAIEQIKEAWVVYPDDMNPDLCDVLSKMLTEDPTERPTVKEVLAMPFFNQPMQMPSVPSLLRPMALPTAQTLIVPKVPGTSKPGTKLAYPTAVKMRVKRQFGSIGGAQPPPLEGNRAPRISSES